MNNDRPENSPAIRYASFSQRLLAHNIDLLAILGLFYVGSLIPETKYDPLLLLLIYWLYYSLFESSVWKSTPGKRILRLKVTTTRSEPWSLLFRNICKVLSLLLLFGGFWMIVLHPKKQGLHDYLAGTYVICRED